MLTEKEIREEIVRVKSSNVHILNLYPATVDINAPRALMQLTAKIKLETLSFVLKEEREKFKCDDFSKANY